MTILTYNPYDFANPVSNKELFIGRKDILDDINYYLNHARNAPRPINLAVIGERASGKTSLLNMIEIRAAERGFLVVRANLDESDAQFPICFFQRIFDAIFTAICAEGGYGGIHGRTYDTYRSMVDSGEIPEDKTFCPFIFPMQYARAMASPLGAIFADYGYQRDLQDMLANAGRPIALLLDECDVLKASRVHLEKFRNVFMNLGGFFLVLSGTTQLFPVITDVFSPIIRQFKKIDVGSFKDSDETQQCILRPFLIQGAVPPAGIDFREIHDLAAGRPYEVQLLCHILYRRLQRKEAVSMSLNLNVIKEVQDELQSSQEVSIRPFVLAVEALTHEDLSTLGLISRLGTDGTPDFLWKVHRLVDREVMSREAFTQAITRFKASGLLVESKNGIALAGDEFDLIYSKYLARQQRIAFISNPSNSRDVVIGALLGRIRRTLRPKGMWTSTPRESLDYELDRLRKANESFRREGANPFTEDESIARALYWQNILSQGQSQFDAIHVQLELDEWTERLRVLPAGSQGSVTEGPRELGLETMVSRLQELGGSLSVAVDSFSVASVEQLTTKVKESGNRNLVEQLAYEHTNRVIDAHMTAKDSRDAFVPRKNRL